MLSFEVRGEATQPLVSFELFLLTSRYPSGLGQIVFQVIPAPTTSDLAVIVSKFFGPHVDGL